MLLKFRIILIVALLLLLGLIINMVRKRQLELKYVLAWLMCDIAVIIFACMPGAMEAAANVLGIHSPMNMIFFLGFVFLLVIIFSMTVALSRVTGKVRKLAQMMALDNYRPGSENEEKSTQ